MYFSTLPAAKAQVKGGRLRALGVTSMKRVAQFPDLPTVNESGLPGFDISYWVGLFMPAGSPVAAMRRINGDVNRIMRSPDTHSQFAARGLGPGGGTPAQLASLLRNDIAKFARIIEDAGLRAP